MSGDVIKSSSKCLKFNFGQPPTGALLLDPAGDLVSPQTPGLVLFYFNLILSNLETTLEQVNQRV